MKISALGIIILSIHSFVSADPISSLESFVDLNQSATVRFVQTVYDSKGDQIEVTNGVLDFKKPGKFKWHYQEPFEQLIICNGRTLWVYDRDLEQVIIRSAKDLFESSPAALLAGTLLASGLLQITDIASYQISPDIIDYCLLILGSSVGCRFADKTFGEIGRNALHSFVATFLLVILGVAAAVVAGLVIDKNFFTLLLSYCPGGIYEVAVIAIFFDLDPEFVSFHHIIRLLMILFTVPVILKLISKKA